VATRGASGDDVRCGLVLAAMRSVCAALIRFDFAGTQVSSAFHDVLSSRRSCYIVGCAAPTSSGMAEADVLLQCACTTATTASEQTGYSS
jgi:hypothetical protein